MSQFFLRQGLYALAVLELTVLTRLASNPTHRACGSRVLRLRSMLLHLPSLAFYLDQDLVSELMVIPL